MSSTCFVRSVRAWVLLAAGCLPCLAAGCPDQQAPQPAAKPFAGTRVVVAVPADYPFAADWKIVLDEWSEQTGATAEIREYDAGKESSPLSARLKEGADPAQSLAEADLLFFSPTELGELAADGRLATLTKAQQPVLDSLDWIDLFPGLRDHAGTLQKLPAVLPLSSPVLVCYYRRDLLERANLKPPETWDEYQQLLDTLDQWAPGLSAVEPWGEESRATMFFARVVAWAKHPENYSVFFNIETGEPLIDSPGFVRALEASRKAVARMPADVRNYSPADCRRELLAGRAALAIAFESPAPHETPSPPQRPDGMAVGVTRLPGAKEVYNRSTSAWETPAANGVNRVTLTGFAGLCAGVSTSSTPAEAQAAWSLLATLAIDRFDVSFGSLPKSPTRKSQMAHPDAWSGAELQPEERLQYVDAVADSLQDNRLIVELPVAGREKFRGALAAALGRALAEPGDPSAPLRAAADEWRNIAGETGTERVVDSYRRVLGLAPRSLKP